MHTRSLCSCHPDKVQDPTLKALKAHEFQKVQEAHELLNDDAKRAKCEWNLRSAERRRPPSTYPATQTQSANDERDSHFTPAGFEASPGATSKPARRNPRPYGEEDGPGSPQRPGVRRDDSGGGKPQNFHRPHPTASDRGTTAGPAPENLRYGREEDSSGATQRRGERRNDSGGGNGQDPGRPFYPTAHDPETPIGSNQKQKHTHTERLPRKRETDRDEKRVRDRDTSRSRERDGYRESKRDKELKEERDEKRKREKEKKQKRKENQQKFDMLSMQLEIEREKLKLATLKLEQQTAEKATKERSRRACG